MTSRTFSNWIILKSALKRLKWFGILYGIALLLELPLLLWMDLSRQQVAQGASWLANEGFRAQMLFHPVAHFTNMAVAVIFGLIIFHYLHQERANVFFHSLPVKRSMLYLQNMLAGVLLIWVPLLVNGLLIRGVLARFGITEAQWLVPQVYGPAGQIINNTGPTTIGVWQLLGYWLLLSMLMTGLFLVFTVFIGMLTGNVLLQGALTIIGLFLPLGLYLLGRYNLMKLLYGFPRSVNDRFIEWLSPVVVYLNDSNFRFASEQGRWYLMYLLILVLLVMATVYLYRLRKAEAAGETLASDWMRWVFKYGVAICGAMTGGIYFNAMNETVRALFIGYAIGGLLGYVISDMIAHKSFHFYKRWKGILVFTAVFIVLVSAVNLDLFGYERYVPARNQVKAVHLGNLGGDGYMSFQPGDVQKGLSSPENIERVRQLHQKIIEMQKENEVAAKRNYNKAVDLARPEFMSRVIPLEITYTLKNGDLVKRTYSIDTFKYREYLAAIFNTEEARRSMYNQFFQLDKGKIDQINVNNHHFGKNIRIYKAKEVKEALAALEEDVLNVSYEAAVEGKRPVKAQVEFVMKEDNYQDHKPIYHLNYYMDFSNFDKFLREHGYFEELFLNPEDVSKIIINKTGSSETTEVTDKKDIELLLNWCHREDERTIKMRQNEVKEWMQFFGTVVKEDGTTIFVGFEGSPYVLQYLQTFFE